MAITFLPYNPEDRRLPNARQPFKRALSDLQLRRQHERDLDGAMRDGDPCPVHGESRQARFWNGWHWSCCGRHVS